MSRESDFARAMVQGLRDAGVEPVEVVARDLGTTVVCSLLYRRGSSTGHHHTRFTAQATAADAWQWANEKAADADPPGCSSCA